MPKQTDWTNNALCRPCLTRLLLHPDRKPCKRCLRRYEACIESWAEFSTDREDFLQGLVSTGIMVVTPDGAITPSVDGSALLSHTQDERAREHLAPFLDPMKAERIERRALCRRCRNALADHSYVHLPCYNCTVQYRITGQYILRRGRQEGGVTWAMIQNHLIQAGICRMDDDRRVRLTPDGAALAYLADARECLWSVVVTYGLLWGFGDREIAFHEIEAYGFPPRPDEDMALIERAVMQKGAGSDA